MSAIWIPVRGLAPAARRLVALAALAAAAPAGAAGVVRCEDGMGHITYSNQPCPSGTTKERGVEYRPAVEVLPGESPPADKNAKPSGMVGKSANAVPPSDDLETKNPERAKELDSEKNKARIARCDDLVHRIEFAQQDALTADIGERASKELNLHRLQEEQKADCSPQS